MEQFKVGYLIGSLAKESINRKLARALVKLAPASLNLSTYVSLYTYGYRNVYELAPQIELDRSILPFEGRLAAARADAASAAR